MNSNVNFYDEKKTKIQSFIINWIIEFPIEKFYGWEFDTDFRYALNNFWDEYYYFFLNKVDEMEIGGMNEVSVW